MKKILFFALITLVCNANLYAQDVGNKVRLGLSAGYIPSSRLETGGTLPNGFKEGLDGNSRGFYGTLFLEFKYNDYLAFQPEISYVNGGGNDHDFNYIFFTPFKIKFFPTEKINFHLSPYFSYFIDTNCPSFTPPEVKRWGISLAPGLEFKLSDIFSITTDYVFMLSDLEGTDIGEIKQNMFRFGLTFTPKLY